MEMWMTMMMMNMVVVVVTGGGSSNNDGAYGYDGYSYYLLCDLNLSKSSSSMTEFDCLHVSHK